MKAPTVEEWEAELLGSYPPAPFVSMAYHDKHLDCIRVEIRDCSMTEHRCDEVFTVLEDNYPDDDQSKYVGFSIKGVAHVFDSLDIPLEGIHLVVEILDQLVKAYPHELVNAAMVELRPTLANTELRVRMAA